jgi:hypothetical protein
MNTFIFSQLDLLELKLVWQIPTYIHNELRLAGGI